MRTAQSFCTLIVGIQQFKESIPGQLLLFYNTLFDRRKGIRYGGQRNAVDIQIQNVHAAVGAVQAPFDRSVHKQIQNDFRAVSLHHLVMLVIAGLNAFHHRLQMISEALPEQIQISGFLRLQIL